jgi:hypothetical protein
MKKTNLFEPFFKKIDKIFFGFEELNEIEKKSEYIECDNEEEFDVERSIN